MRGTYVRDRTERFVRAHGESVGNTQQVEGNPLDVNKLGPGQRIAAGAAVLLLIDLWLDWYSVGNDAFSINLNAWQSYSWTDLLLFVTVIVALAMAAQA